MMPSVENAAKIREMVSVSWNARRLIRLIALGAMICAWVPVQVRIATRQIDRSARSMFEASAWAATLPSVLIAPAVAPGWQLVSMIADDIDADGDLDVVANDGSLDLIVWINDGTGRLSRQEGRKPSSLPEKMTGPGLSDHPTRSQALAQTPSSVLQIYPSIESCLPNESRARWTGSPDPLALHFISTRSPRGPPLVRLLG